MTANKSFPRAFAIRFRELERWDPASFERITWHWPKEMMAEIGSVLKLRKEKVDRSRFAFSELQPITIHFDGSVDHREVDGNREYKMDLLYAHPGDIVVAKIDLKNGAVATVPTDWRNVVVTNHFAVYEPDRSKLLPEYLQRIIQTSFFKSLLWRNKVGAEGRKEVKLDFFESLQVPLLPLPMQHAILERWDKTQREISEANFRIKQLENEIPLLLYSELGVSPPAFNSPIAKYLVQRWKNLERWSFKHIARARQGLLGFTNSKFPILPLSQCLLDTRNGYCIKPVTGPTTYKMLKLSALTPAGLDVTESKFVNVSKRVAEKFSLHKGDLLICRSVGSYEYIAKSALVENDEPCILFPDIIIRARFNSSILPEYVREVIQTPLGRSYFQSSARTAVGMWKIGAEDIRNFPVPLPPLDEQRNIIHQVEGIRIEIAREQGKARSLAADVQQEVEEMLLGTRPVPECDELQKGTA
jgi:type I restriction enzyme S subunit